MPRKNYRRKRRTRKTLAYRSRNYKMAGAAMRTTGTRVTGTHLFKRTCSITNPVHTNVAFAASGNAGAAMYSDVNGDAWIIRNQGVGGLNVGYFAFAVNFTLDMLPSYSEFTVLFDQYKINGIKLKITPFSNMAPVQTGVAGSTANQALSGFLHSIVDYDDADVAVVNPSKAGIDGIRQFQSYKCKQLFRPGACLSRYIKPHIAVGAYGGSVFTSFMNSNARWIDSNSTNVEHYGIKGIFEVFQPDTAAAIFLWYKVEATFYLSFRNPR